VWDPRTWPDLVKGHRSIRTQINRARNKQVTTAEGSAPAARTDPALRRVLAEWLATKNLPPMHFLNPSDPAAGPLDDRLLFTAFHDGQPVAFLLASPVPGRNGHLVEQLARSPHAPNGTAELLIDHAFRALAARGHTYATLGLVPLSTHASYRDNPLWLRFLVAWARAHGRRFYNFDGLESFRTKLHPDCWEPRYAIANRPAFPPAALYAIGAVMFGASPIPVLARALATAVRHELSTFFISQPRPRRIISMANARH
jgi:phosphatidylglycerol lysyltransferase